MSNESNICAIWVPDKDLTEIAYFVNDVFWKQRSENSINIVLNMNFPRRCQEAGSGMCWYNRHDLTVDCFSNHDYTISHLLDYHHIYIYTAILFNYCSWFCENIAHHNIIDNNRIEQVAQKQNFTRWKIKVLKHKEIIISLALIPQLKRESYLHVQNCNYINQRRKWTLFLYLWDSNLSVGNDILSF